MAVDQRTRQPPGRHCWCHYHKTSRRCSFGTDTAVIIGSNTQPSRRASASAAQLSSHTALWPCQSNAHVNPGARSSISGATTVRRVFSVLAPLKAKSSRLLPMSCESGVDMVVTIMVLLYCPCRYMQGICRVYAGYMQGIYLGSKARP